MGYFEVTGAAITFWDEAGRQFLQRQKSTDKRTQGGCGISEPTPTQIIAASKLLQESNPGATTPKAAIGDTFEWWHFGSGIEVIFVPDQVCGDFAEPVVVEKTVEAPKILPRDLFVLFTLKQGENRDYELGAFLTDYKGVEKVKPGTPVAITKDAQVINVEGKDMCALGLSVWVDEDGAHISVANQAVPGRYKIAINDGENTYQSITIQIEEKPKPAPAPAKPAPVAARPAPVVVDEAPAIKKPAPGDSKPSKPKNPKPAPSPVVESTTPVVTPKKRSSGSEL